MGVIYWLLVCVYCLFLLIATLFIGLNWNKIQFKWKQSPQTWVVLVYTFNFIFQVYVFGLPFVFHLLFNIILLIAVYFGVNMQMIGLTGGIGTGKSTVTSLLSKEGFNIIDSDKICRDVRQLRH